MLRARRASVFQNHRRGESLNQTVNILSNRQENSRSGTWADHHTFGHVKRECQSGRATTAKPEVGNASHPVANGDWFVVGRLRESTADLKLKNSAVAQVAKRNRTIRISTVRRHGVPRWLHLYLTARNARKSGEECRSAQVKTLDLSVGTLRAALGKESLPINDRANGIDQIARRFAFGHSTANAARLKPAYHVFGEM